MVSPVILAGDRAKYTLDVFGLTVVLALFALLILLPLTTSARMFRVSRELEELRDRVAQLESLLRGAPAAPPPPPPIPTVVALDAPAAPAVPVAPDAAAPAAPAAPVDGTEPIAPVAPLAPVAPGAVDAPEELDFEGRIGGRWLLYTGVLVLLFGVSFFLKYAFDNEWINETGRVISGGLAGVALIIAGWRLAARDLRAFGQALIGTGLAILYLALYAAYNYYELINQVSAFTLMVLVTIAAALIADRHRSQALAFIAVGGGFVTPYLVGGSEDAQLTLFTYDALLIAGTLVLSLRHDWVALNALSYVMTFITVVAWAAAYYRESLWLRTFLFLTLYCVMFVQIFRQTRQSRARLARLVVALLTTAPLVYHVAAIVMTARHPPAIHVYLIAFTAVGLWLTAEPHLPGRRLLVLVGAYVPLFGSLTLPDGLSWLVPNTVTIVAIAALHGMAILDRSLRQEQVLEGAELVTLHVTLLGLFGLLYQTIEPAYPEYRGALGALLALVALALWQILQSRDFVASLNACAIAFTLTALAIAVQFDGPAVVVGWAAEGAAAAWLGLRARSFAFQAGGLALWGFAVARLLDGYFVTPAGFTAIFNERALTTLFVVALAYVVAWMYSRARDTIKDAGRTRAVLHVAASVVTMLWITAEVRSYWDIRYETPQAYLYKQLGLSLAWGLYGALLIVIGLRRAYAPDRYIGITVLAITILKVFFVDLWELGGIYRVIGFVVFGALLLAVSYLYQQRRQGSETATAPPPPAEPIPPLDRQESDPDQP